MFKVIKAKLKEATEEWHKYLIGKELILCTSLEGQWAVIGIEGEDGLNGFCEFIWNSEEEHEYETLEGFKNDMDFANTWFAFEDDDIEIIEEISTVDVDKYLKEAREEE